MTRLCIFILFICPLVMAGQPQSLYLPHFTVKNGEWQTRISLSNTESIPADVRLTAHDDSGQVIGSAELRIAPHGALMGDVANLFPQGLAASSGSMHFEANVVLTGQMTFTSVAGGGSTSLPLVPTPNKNLILPYLQQENDIASGLAITNTSDAEANIRITMVDLEGIQSNRTTTISLPAQGRNVLMANQLFPQSSPMANSRLEVSGDQALAALALTFHQGNRQIVAVPAQNWEPGLLHTIQTINEDAYALSPIAGLISGVQNGGENPVLAATGLADIDRGIPMTTDLIADAGSITKTYVSALTLLYQEEGLLHVSTF